MKQVTFLSLMAAAAASSVEQANIFDVDDTSDNPVSRFDINFDDSESSTNTVTTTARTGSPNTPVSCKDGSETLIAQEELRWELQYLNLSYLENAGIEKACVASSDTDGTSCKFDFGLFPNNLDEVCEKYGGVYEEREHSIQCHNPTTKKQLYYQIDRFPNCFPGSCQPAEVDFLVNHQIESVRRALEEDSGMICYADYDILRHAGEGESAGYRTRPWMVSWIAAATSLYMHYSV